MPSRDEGDSQGDGRGKGMTERDACRKNNRERVREMMRRGLRHKRRGSAVPPVCATFSQLPSSMRYPIKGVTPVAFYP